MNHPGVDSVFAFAGAGGLNQNTAGASSPKDTIGQIQLETIPWENRKNNPDLDGNLVIAELLSDLQKIPGIKVEVLELARGPASSKPVHLRLKGVTGTSFLPLPKICAKYLESTEGLTLIEDTRPLPGIDWQINVDVEKAGRFGADVTTVGAMVQLVTRGFCLIQCVLIARTKKLRNSVRLPENYRILSTLDTLKVRTEDGLVPLSNFITKSPVKKLAEINRIDQKRFFDIKAAVKDGLKTTLADENGNETEVFINANERIAHLTKYLGE